MDGSVVGRGCLALMRHVVYNGRALPLAGRGRHSPTGHWPEELHIAMVELRSTVIPAAAHGVLLGDGECDGTALQARRSERGWPTSAGRPCTRRRHGTARPCASMVSAPVANRGGGLRSKRSLAHALRMAQSWCCVVGRRGRKSPCLWAAIWRQPRRRVACIKSASALRPFSQTRQAEASIFSSRIEQTHSVFLGSS